MQTEIERKFLVVEPTWKENVLRSFEIRQGYLSGSESGASIRARVRDDEGVLTIKEKRDGMERIELEYKIPLEEARFMIDNFSGTRVISKTRYLVPLDGHTWEVDVFHGQNKGLILAEIELDSQGTEFERPDWLGPEVTEHERFYNGSLAKKPFREWQMFTNEESDV